MTGEEGSRLARGEFGRLALAAARLSWRSSRSLCVTALALMAVVSLTPAGAAWASKLLVDGLAGLDAGPVSLPVIAALVVIIGGVGSVLGHIVGFIAGAQQRAITVHTEGSLYAAVNRLPGLRHFEDPEFQDRLRLAEQSATSAPGAVANMLVALVRTVVTVGSFVGVVLTVWWPMAGLLALVGGVAVWTQFVLARRGAGAAETMISLRRRRFSYQSLLTNLAAIKEIRLMGLGDLFLGRMADGLVETNRREHAVERHSALAQGGLAALGSVVAMAGVALVAYRATQRLLSPGDVVLFVAAVVGVQAAFSGTIGQLASVGRSVRLFRHYLGLLDTPSDLPDGKAPAGPLRSKIEFRDVWFRYDPTGEWVLRGVDLVLPAGEAIGLVGLNGAGKSTLIKLLCRFYDPERGRITWDGVDLRELSIVELRSRLGATFQDFMTYELTAAENIGIGDLAHLDDRERIERAAALAEADGLINRFPRGYDTLVSRMFFDGATRDQGVALSGGQGQRIALARSFMRPEADLLILDEPSSGLDVLAEQQLTASMREHRAGRTTVLISHRLSTLREADRIAVLEDGRIVEYGGHDALMAAGGSYATLFNTQASGYQDEPLPERIPQYSGPFQMVSRQGRMNPQSSMAEPERVSRLVSPGDPRGQIVSGG